MQVSMTKLSGNFYKLIITTKITHNSYKTFIEGITYLPKGLNRSRYVTNLRKWMTLLKLKSMFWQFFCYLQFWIIQSIKLILTNYLRFIPYPTNWVSFALSLVEPKRSTTYGWVSMKTSRNSLKSLKRIYFQLIWLKGLSISTSHSPVMSTIPQSLFQMLPLTFISNYLTLALFLLSRWKRFANLLSVIVTTLI